MSKTAKKNYATDYILIIFFWTTNLSGLVSDVMIQMLFHQLQVVRLDIFWDMLGTQSIHTKKHDIKCRLYKVLATFCSSLPMIYLKFKSQKFFFSKI